MKQNLYYVLFEMRSNLVKSVYWTHKERQMKHLATLVLIFAITGQAWCDALAKSSSSKESSEYTGIAVDTSKFFDDSFGPTSKSFEERLWQAQYLGSKKPAVDAVLAFLDLLALDKKGKSNLTETERVRAIDQFCRVLCKYGRIKRANQLIDDELARLKKLEPNDEYVLQEAYLQTDVAIIYVAQSKFTLAEELFEKAQKVFIEKLGANHPKTILTIADIASMKQHMQNFPEAELKYKEAFDQALKQPKYGRLALETLASDYESCLSKQGKVEECSCVKQQIGVDSSQRIQPIERLQTK